ncbi:unnamed protein product [Owenia fusiformis]|uniref:Uncharacterized protein n=1 Tax=Owenia fusiformis TaxID=6347 RepID=A0A8J1U5T9_OWEFU|nr:unnamed protein product [Owenia fusiformis]
MPSLFSDIHDPAARVRALCEYGCKVEVDKAIPPRRYFRSGVEMLRMATQYHSEGDLESAFVLYSKYIALFVEKLPKHPEYKSTSPEERERNKKKMVQLFPLAEQVKKQLKERYSKEEELRQIEQRRVEEELAKQQEQERIAQEEQRANEEQRIRNEQERQYKILQEQELERQRQLEQDKDKIKNITGVIGGVTIADAAVNIPISPTAPPLGPPPDIDNSSLPPPPAYGEVYSGESKRSDIYKKVLPDIPSRDLKPVSPSAPPASDTGAITAGAGSVIPEYDRSAKPNLDHFTSVGASTSNKHGLRSVIVPQELMVKFLNIARSNTDRNIETCGILAGKLASNVFKISHVLIPKQSGTPDSCTTANEEELFDYQDKYDLITLGWIHTHPTQTAFLSSVDLHTHCSYQLMMPEAIAIVCAPKYNETGIFMLTPEYGLQFVANCTQTKFHPHPKEPPLFEDCCHVTLDPTASVTMADLRR